MADARTRFETDDTSWLAEADPSLEGQFVERKEWADANEMARQVSGFANGHPPGGLLVVGVRADGSILGLASRGEAAINDRLNRLRDLVEGWEYRFVPIAEGGDRLLFIWAHFSERRVVCRSDGKAFRRVGSSTVEIGEDELRELRYQRGERSFEDEPCVPFEPDLLDEDLARQFIAGMERRNGLTMPLTIDHALRLRSLIVDTPRGPSLTHAAVLVMAKTPLTWLGGARLRFLRFEGREELTGTARNVVKDRWFEGPVPRIISAFQAAMREQIREFDRLGPDGRFITEPEYPEFAWLEAVVNALVHRSYSLSTRPVFVRMFDDRLEVESPGGFPGQVTPENLVHHPRNPHLAGALQYLELVRLAQEGTRRMRAEMETMGLPPPVFHETSGPSVLVTLKNDIDRRRAGPDRKASAARWQVVLELLADSLVIRTYEGLRQWSDLTREQLSPPAEVIHVAVRKMLDSGAPSPLRDSLRELLWHSDEAAAAAAAVLEESLRTGPVVGEEIWREVPRLIGRAHPAAESLLAWLESLPVERMGEDLLLRDRSGAGELILRDPSRKLQVDLALQSVCARLQHPPQPDRSWIVRALALSGKFRPLESARQLHQLITGRQSD